MGRLATGIVIAVTALVIGGLFRDVQAGEPSRTPVAGTSYPIPVAVGPSSGRVLSLLLALEALRAAPAPTGTSTAGK